MIKSSEKSAEILRAEEQLAQAKARLAEAKRKANQQKRKENPEYQADFYGQRECTDYE